MKNIYRTFVNAVRKLTGSAFDRDRFDGDSCFAMVQTNFAMLGLAVEEEEQVDYLVPEGFGFFLMERGKRNARRFD